MPERLQKKVMEMEDVKWVNVIGLFDMVFEIYPPY